ncbi:helix-turn-helix domain-containing protein [Leifsonia sp. F6_8S_P_1B]|uniref:Helix-turn-helix domain-containing protein n=1 Tax=Leifsonia williamsii TaxID=3035919 RepID=A0ABT8K750_9MICO|nr:helix-turn-helix domain-containing protein [Leifsonia williamsii]MDN4613271.1 helix-turn-helix domain-containing protein [Leifsonia williamsii]
MTTTLLKDGTLFVDEELRLQAEQFVAVSGNRSVRGVRVVLDDDSEVMLSAELAEFVGRVLDGSANGSVNVSLLPKELTTTQAAELLGVSRPTLMKWVGERALPARRVGTHTRLATDVVLRFREQVRAHGRMAFYELRSWAEDNDAHD